MARQQPVVVLLEDIHWADETSLDIVPNLAAALPNNRLLMICVARPQLLERRSNWGEGLEHHSMLELKPLSAEASDALVDELLQLAVSIPQPLRDLLISNAEGNPFYTEELVKTLIDDGVIVREEEHWRIDEGRLQGHRVPATLTNVLQARLDGLPVEERAIVQRAAVVGRLFWDATVADLADRKPDEIQPSLAAIRKRDLVVQHDRSSFADVLEYAFRHSLLRDVAYETVLLAARRTYHARVAHWLETNAGERLGEYLDLVAEHYLLGGENGRAADYLEQAATQALNAGAYQSARNTYEHVLTLRQDIADTTESVCNAYVRLGEACWQLGDYPASESALDRGLELARQIGDQRAEANALYYLSKTAASLGDFEQAQTRLDEALPPARVTGGEDLARVLYGLGSTAWRTGDMDAARTHTLECLEIAQAQGYGSLEIMALNVLGLVAGSQSDEETELANYKKCLELARKIGDLFREAIALANLGVMAILRDDDEEALGLLEAAVDIFRELGRQESVALNLANLATVHLKLGNLDEAKRYARETLRLAQQLGATPRILGALLAWAEILIAEGRMPEALAIIGMTRRHPAHEYQFQDEIQHLITATGLSPEESEAGLAAGADLELDELIARILDET
ncbi:MAG: tetratricopeptide repeat protein [Chloroflexota bacterium]